MDEFRRTRSSITHSSLKLHRRSRSDTATLIASRSSASSQMLEEIRVAQAAAQAAAPGTAVQLASADSDFEGSSPLRHTAPAGVTVWPSSQAWSAERDRGGSTCSRSLA